jgi:pyoverdine/dityrosine biosynthesis protein Dit1
VLRPPPLVLQEPQLSSSTLLPQQQPRYLKLIRDFASNNRIIQINDDYNKGRKINVGSEKVDSTFNILDEKSIKKCSN